MIDEKEIEQDLWYIKDKAGWVHYPLCSMVNREEGSKLKCGMIIAGDDNREPVKLYVENIFTLKDKGITKIEQIRMQIKCIEFPNLVEMIKEGWRVD